MKKIFNRFTKLFSGMAVSLLATGMILAPMKVSALSIPYDGANTPPAPYPAFNIFTGTPSEGDEHDFLRGKVKGDTNASTNVVNTACDTGTTFTLRIYVHNGASQYNNGTGDGASVAHGVNVKVGNITGTGTTFTPDAFISASNAQTVTDDMRINCTNGQQVTMSYVKGTAQQFTGGHGYQPVSDNIVTTGAAVGTNGPDGNVWGCWEQRVWVTLDVTVTKVTPTISEGVCKLVDVLPGDNRSVKATVSGTVNNATIVGYEINWGDGSPVSNKQTDSHTYTKDGTYTITTKVNVKFVDGNTEWKTASTCTKQITFKPGVPPVVPPVTPPTTLVNTGPGSTAAVFAAFSIAGAMAYRVFVTRRLSE
ncbi:MAG: PKD domain-containing protein [Candidatus Saccharibacteria bacterium]